MIHPGRQGAIPSAGQIQLSANPGAPLSAGQGPHDQKRLGPGGHFRWEPIVGGGMRQILPAGEEPDEGATLVGRVVANRAPKRRVTGLQRIEDGALGDRAWKLEGHFPGDLRQGSEVIRKHNPDHARDWTSTDSTGGRSRTIGVQLSPSSGEAYTCPPVVPK